MTAPTPNNTKSGGDLLSLQSVAKKSGVSESTIKRIIQLGYIEPIKISGRRFMYYRDFLRAQWEYESNKERSGRKPANANWED